MSNVKQQKSEEKIQKKRNIEYFKEQYKKSQSVVAFLREALHQNKTHLVVGGALTAVAGLASSGIPLLEKVVINGIQSGEMAITVAGVLGTTYAIAGSLRHGIDNLGSTVASWFYRRMENRMSNDMLEKVINIPPLAHSKKDTDNNYLANAVTGVSENSREIFHRAFDLLYYVPLVLGSLGVLYRTSPQLVLPVIGACAAKVALSQNTAQKLRTLTDSWRSKLDTSRADRTDIVQNHRFFKTHNQIPTAIQQNTKNNEAVLSDEMSLDKRWAGLQWAMQGFDALAIGCVMYYTMRPIIQAHDPGTFAAMVGALTGALGTGTAVADKFREMKKSFLKYQDNLKALEYDKAYELQRGHEKISGSRGIIRFNDVSVTYPLEKTPVFEHLSMQINPGELTVITGESGVGKTTLLNLLQHMMEPGNGQITINGVNVSKIQDEDLYKHIAIVHQTQQFLNRKSIMENLKLVREGITDEEIYEVMKALDLHEIIQSKKDGYNTPPGQLSGGQKQRLAFAQALLKEAPIVLLDEPTSGLDAKTEQKVFDRIKKLAREQGKTVIIISHDLTHMAVSDRVIFLEKGKIIEDGRPRDLIRGTGKFHEFYKKKADTLLAPLRALEGPPEDEPVSRMPIAAKEKIVGARKNSGNSG